jgi:glucan 1,3-beta-glucosidase
MVIILPIRICSKVYSNVFNIANPYSGSGGFLSDLTFHGGGTAAQFGNQQFTTRGLTFHNSIIAIDQIWDWGWTYKSISFNNCGTGIRMSAGGRTAQLVGSVTLIDSTFTNVQVGIITAYDSSSLPTTAGGLILENIQLNNVPIAVQGAEGTALVGTTGSMTVSAWGEGHEYTPNGPNQFQGPIAPISRPTALLSGSTYYERSKPQYEGLPVSQFVSLRTSGAKGDGVTDDTAVINSVLSSSAETGKVVFFDAGIYKVSSTISIPAGSKIVRETYPIIMGSGPYFSDMNNPQVVVRVGKSGDSGSIEWSDMIVSTQGATAGAILIEWNLASSSSSPSGMWDVHVRIGGFIGSNLQNTQCPEKSAVGTPVNTNCIAAYMSMHVTSSATGLYMENVSWLGTPS